MRHIGSRRRGFSIQALLRRAAIGLRCCARRMTGFFKAASGELGRLNAVGIPPGGGGNHTRRERAAMARKALSERYRGRARCC
jgi:hypothetical protein